MIFPRECKEVGFASTKPCGDRVYFLSRYLVREAGDEYELFQVELDPTEKGMLRTIRRSKRIASVGEISWYPKKVQLYDRKHLVDLAIQSGTRCTLFSGLDEHLTFVCDPDPTAFLTIHVYDIEPPLPTLSATLRDLEKSGLFGDLDISLEHHIRNISTLNTDIYPCRAAGFSRTLDADRVRKGDHVAGCLTAVQLIKDCSAEDVTVEDICPLGGIEKEPFIARCCRSEREGVGTYGGKFGAILHWAAPPWRVAQSLTSLVQAWREHESHRRG